MSADPHTPVESDAHFHEKLQRLRVQIDALPESQRPHLLDLAETIARQHRRLQQKRIYRHDVV